jgi:glycine cleavage system H lipoate-binding protein
MNRAEKLTSNPENINNDPYGSWFIQLEGGVAIGLLDTLAYESYCVEQH